MPTVSIGPLELHASRHKSSGFPTRYVVGVWLGAYSPRAHAIKVSIQ